MAGWGEFAAAAVNAYGAYSASSKAADAAKQGGAQIAAGTEQATALQREIYADQRNLTMPAYNDGEMARSRLMQLMGLGGGSAQGGSQGGSLAQQYGAYQAPQFAGGAQNYVTEGADGMPTPNAQLYASNPQYKAAWDQTLQQHQDQWKGNGYHAGSDNDWISERIGQRMPSMQASGGQYGAGGAAGGTAAPAMSQNDAFAAFRNTPGYQFGMDEGNKSVQASAAARGGLNSGATLKALQKFGTDYADQQGYRPYVSNLQSLAGLSQTAAGQMGSYGSNFANNAGNNAIAGATARGNSTYAAGQARADGYAQAGAFANDAWGAYQQGRR